MVMNKIRVLGLILTFSSLTHSSELPPPKKCCPKNFVLNKRTLPSQRGHKGPPEIAFECLEIGFIKTSESFLPHRLFNLSETDNSKKLISTPWGPHENHPIGMPNNCHGGKKMVLQMQNPFLYLVTTEGTLLSLGGIFELDFQLGDFCLDLMLQNEGISKELSL